VAPDSLSVRSVAEEDDQPDASMKESSGRHDDATPAEYSRFSDAAPK